jgi:hypothetical protein
MKKILLSLFLLLSTIILNAQTPSCDEVMKFIKSNGYKKGSVSSYQLINSSWLKEVNAYTYDGDIYVIAKIKTDNYDYWGKDYIFCGIPSRNWSDFSGISFNQETYGEKFHKYIIDYICNCK